MKKITILLISAFMAFAFNVCGQLSAGDIAIIGIGADNPDDFHFVLLVDISSGTEITFTDSGVLSDGSFRGNEGAVKWTAPSNLTAGTIISFITNSTEFVVANDPIVGTNGFNLSGSGDQVIAFIGSSSSPTFIYAAQINSNVWQVGSDDSNQSDLPPGLINGTTAVAAGAGSGPEDEYDNAWYSGTTTGTQASLLTSISNNSNWTGNNSSYSPYTTSFTVSSGGANVPPSISNIIQTPSEDISSSTTVSVSADVTDSDGTITNVELHWGTATGSLGNTINMSNAGGDTYTTDSDIPAQSGGTTVYYEVEATDDEPETTTSPEQSYTVYPYSATLPYSEDFTTGFGQCYTKSALGSTKEWEWNSGGYAYMNGYDSGETEEDWLILPGIDFDSYTDELMTFDTWYKYGDGDDDTHYLKLFYSADYPGVGDPTTSTWTELNFTRPTGWETWTNSLVVDLSSVTGSSVFIGFKYHYESDSYRTWEVDNISIHEGTRVNVTFQVDMAEQTVTGDGVHIAGSFENWWNPSGIELLDGDLDDVFTTTLSLFSGEEYQFKYLNGNTWGTDETVPTGCQAAGTSNRYEVIGGVDYSLDEVCFNSCEDCGVLNNYDITFQVDMQNENVTGDVNIAGSFNGWSDQAMTNTSGSIWEITLALAETTYHTYKFKNGGSWESFDGPCLASSWGDRYITVPSANTTLDLVCFNSCDACPVADFVIINEVDADDILTDDLEFIELFDGGVGNTNLSGLVVVLFNGSDDASYDPVADLDGNSTDANGYFVIGNALVPNVDLILSNGFLQNGADAVGLFVGDGVDFPDNTPVTTTNLLDALVYDTDDADDAGLLVLLNTGEPQINEGERGNKDEHSNQRIPNGSGGPRNTSTYDQSIPTPGAMNTSINTNWTGIVDDNWDDAGNWDNGVPVSLRDVFIPDVSKAAYPVITSSATCNSLFMAGGSFLDIAPSGDLTVIGTFTNNGTLTIKSDVSGTGSLIENNGVNATVERYYTGGEW
ncbi:MAG: choice-of-anchor J domain-containing protein, partial [Bacteroidales bacterium]|nr:choice-of-anchor J domain-containing protein [Bacteroidales bacterium]